MALLLTVTGAPPTAIEPDADGRAAGGGGAWIGLGSGVRGVAGANMAGCGDAVTKTGTPAASDDRISGSAVSWLEPVGCDTITPGGSPVVPASPAAASPSNTHRHPSLTATLPGQPG